MAENPFNPEIQLMRKLVLTPCASMEALGQWCRFFLGLDFPDQLIDPESTSSPLETFWELYDAGVNCRPLKMDDGSDSRRAMVYASRDSYKCTRKGTRILTPYGLRKIEDLSAGEEVWSGQGWRKIVEHIHDGEKESVEVELRDGRSITGSPIHRIWTWSPGSSPTWKKLSDLNPDTDLVMVDAVASRNFVLNQEEYDVAYMLGALAGDGCMTMMIKHGTACVTASDPVVRDAWINFCVKNVGRPPKPPRPERPYDYWICSREICNILMSMGCDVSYAHEKKAPEYAFRSYSTMAGFLSGLLDTDGTVSSKNNIEFPLTSKRLLLDAQLMLNALGVHCYVRSNRRLYGKQKHLVHRLVIKAREFETMEKNHVRILAKKAQKIRPRLDKTKDTHDGIPYEFVKPLLESLPRTANRWREEKGVFKPKISKQYPTVCREKMSALLDWAEVHGYLDGDELGLWRDIVNRKWVRPIRIEKGRADFYDLEVEVDHSYWSNGVISHNTLGAAALELLALVHMDRNVVHLAAIEDQASKAQSYLRDFLDKEYLEEFRVGENKRTIAVLWFEHKQTGDILTNKEWKLLGAEKHRYQRHVRYAKIIVNTMASSNSEHCSWVTVDEVDLIRFVKAYNEAKLIPSTQRGLDGRLQPPITLLTSTRKSAGGLVQKELDEAEKTKTLIRHWNILDVTEACPASRHRPDEPKQTRWYSDATLQSYSPEEYEDFKTRDPKAASKCASMEVFAGCAKCTIMAACKGRLVNQKSKAGLCKSIDDTIGKFNENSIEMALAQLLCRKPGNEGAIYPNFSKETHMMSARDIWREITGDEPPPVVTKEMLIAKFAELGAECSSGMDFGYTHCFAVVTGWKFGRRMFVLDAFEIPGLELSQCVELCDQRIKAWDPTIWPDVAYPAYIKTFNKNGYRTRTHKKDVVGGIDAVRAKMLPVGTNTPELILLKGDEGCEHLANRIIGYKWKTDQAGQPTSIPDETDDDLDDALRYLVQNTFKGAGKIIISKEPVEVKQVEQAPTKESWMTQEIQALTGGNYSPTPAIHQEEAKPKKRRGFFYSI